MNIISIKARDDVILIGKRGISGAMLTVGNPINDIYASPENFYMVLLDDKRYKRVIKIIEEEYNKALAKAEGK